MNSFEFVWCSKKLCSNLFDEWFSQLSDEWYTVWSGELSVTQILREIDFGESRISKIGVSAIWGTQNFVKVVDLSLQKVKKIMKIKIQSCQMCANRKFCTFQNLKNWFHVKSETYNNHEISTLWFDYHWMDTFESILCSKNVILFHSMFDKSYFVNFANFCDFCEFNPKTRVIRFPPTSSKSDKK